MQALLVTGMEGAANCAQALQTMLGISMEIAAGRRAAITALRKREYDLVVVDDSLADSDPAGTDPLWEAIGMAQPVTVNFVLSGTERVAREIRAALRRREREQELALRAATVALETELKSTVAGLLLHSQLALATEPLPEPVAGKLRLMADLVATLRDQLSTGVTAQ